MLLSDAHHALPCHAGGGHHPHNAAPRPASCRLTRRHSAAPRRPRREQRSLQRRALSQRGPPCCSADVPGRLADTMARNQRAHTRG